MNNKDQNFIINFIKEKTEKVYKRNIKEVTDFLDPLEISICEEFLKKNKNNVNYLFYGGYEEAERRRLCIAPNDEDIEEEDFNIMVIEASIKKINREINHRDILGAMMSTGIKREKTGDIFILPQGAAIIADKAMVTYLSGNFPMIKGNVFSTEIFEPEKYKFPQVEVVEKVINVSSYRLDGVIAKAYNLSRGDSQEFIRSGKVKVNHRENLKTDYLLENDDIVSVRTKGRFIIKEEIGKTKKDNFRVLINIY